MIALSIVLSLLFTWLLYETDWLRVRLPQYAPISEHNTQKIERFEPVLGYRSHQYKHDSIGYLLPARTVKSFGYTMNLVEGCNICRAKLLREVVKAQNLPKTHQSHRVSQFPIITDSITQELCGQHKERETWTAYDGKQYSCDKMVADYKPIFHKCLVPEKWLRKHYNDVIPELTIELKVSGKTIANINGDFKVGMIKQLIKQEIK